VAGGPGQKRRRIYRHRRDRAPRAVRAGATVRWLEVPDTPSFDELCRLDDATLVARARTLRVGDAREQAAAQRCLALFFERYRDLVRTLCARKAPRDAVDDLENGTYERFVRAVQTMSEPIESPVGLLVTLARWTLADWLEASGRRPEQPEADPDRHRADAAGGLEALVDQAFLALLEPLDERQRAVVIDRIGLDLPSEQVARRLAISPGNVDVILFRSLAKLRRSMAG
jgi:RNA polymerase sigma factor (sigma-70 family)